MLVVIASLVIINLMLSIDNIIPILLLVDALPKKTSRNSALFFGLMLGALLRCVLVFFAAQLFALGTIIYIISGFFLLYIGIKGLMSREGGKKEVKHRKRISLASIIISIAVIDISLSIDNIVALVAVTQVFSLLVIGILISVVILFGLSFGLNTFIQRIKGLDIAAYISVVFLGLKFLAFPFGINPSNTLTSATIIAICLLTVASVYTKHYSRKLIRKRR